MKSKIGDNILSGVQKQSSLYGIMITFYKFFFFFFFYQQIVIEVSTPSSMVMLRNFPVETVVGSHLQAAVTMKTLNGCAKFHNYLELPACYHY